MCFKVVTRKFKGCFKKVLRVFQETLKGASRKIEGCFNRVFSGFQRCLKEIQWMFEEYFKVISRKC